MTRPCSTCGSATCACRCASSGLHESVQRLYAELRRKGIRFRPHLWLSEEWFSPDGMPGIAIPFYLAHPRLNDSSGASCTRSRAATTSGSCASCVTRPAMRSTLPLRLRRRKALARGLRQGLAPLSFALFAAARQPAFRTAPRPLVRAEPSDRGFCGDVCGVAAAPFALAQPIRRLAGTAQAGIRRCDDARAGGQPGGSAEPRRRSSR